LHAIPIVLSYRKKLKSKSNDKIEKNESTLLSLTILKQKRALISQDSLSTIPFFSFS